MATLDLRGLTTEDVTVIDRNDREWPVHDGLPLRTAIALMELAPAWEEGRLSPEQLEKTVDGVLAVFRRKDADVTRDQILDAFDVDDLIKIILFLSTRVESRTTDAASPEPTETPLAPEKTTKRKR